MFAISTPIANVGIRTNEKNQMKIKAILHK